MARYLGVDVDQVVVEPPWVDWLSNRSPIEDVVRFKRVRGKLDYALGNYFPSVENPKGFWEGLDYTGLRPLPGAADALEKLSKHFKIVFVSLEMGSHGKSKKEWLKHNFPYMEGYVATEQKYLLNNSVVAMIDDRMKNLVGFAPEKRVLFDTRYKQDVGYEDIYTRMVLENGWLPSDSGCPVKRILDAYL